MRSDTAMKENRRKTPTEIARQSLATWFLALSAVVVATCLAIHIWGLSGLTFTNHDDMSMGLRADVIKQGGWRAYYGIASGMAAKQGRIYFHFSMFFFILPFLIRSLLVRAVVAALLQFLATSAMAALLGSYLGWINAVLFVCLVSGCLPYWLGYYPVNHIPFVYHIPVLLFFAGMALYVQLARGAMPPQRLRRFYQASSFLLVFFSLLFYESLILPFLIVCLVVVAAENSRIHGTLSARETTKAAGPWLLIFVLWLGSYVCFRRLHPSAYDGSQFAPFTLAGGVAAAKSLLIFVAYSLPGANFVANRGTISSRGIGSVQTLGYLHFAIANLRADAIALALLILGVVALWASNLRSAFGEPCLRTRHRTVRRILVVTTLALACGLMAPALQVLTPKYGSVDSARAWAPYLSGYYSFLAWMVVLALAFPLLAIALRPWRNVWLVVTALLGLGCACVSAMTAVANDAVAGTQRELSAKWKLIELLTRTHFFAGLPPNAGFIAPSLWDGTPNPSWDSGKYWTKYFSARAARPVSVAPDFGEVRNRMQHAPVYYLEHQWLPDREHSVLLISRIGDFPAATTTSDSVLLVCQRDFKSAALEFLSSTPGLNQLAPGFWRVLIPAFQYENGAFVSEVQTPGLVVGTGRLVDRAAGRPVSAVSIVFKRGFSAMEQNGGHYWHWSDGPAGEGELDLRNSLPQSVAVHFRTILRFDPSQKNVAFYFTLPNASEVVNVADGESFDRIWTLQPGSNGPTSSA